MPGVKTNEREGTRAVLRHGRMSRLQGPRGPRSRPRPGRRRGRGILRFTERDAAVRSARCCAPPWPTPSTTTSSTPRSSSCRPASPTRAPPSSAGGPGRGAGPPASASAPVTSPSSSAACPRTRSPAVGPAGRPTAGPAGPPGGRCPPAPEGEQPPPSRAPTMRSTEGHRGRGWRRVEAADADDRSTETRPARGGVETVTPTPRRRDGRRLTDADDAGHRDRSRADTEESDRRRHRAGADEEPTERRPPTQDDRRRQRTATRRGEGRARWVRRSTPTGSASASPPTGSRAGSTTATTRTTSSRTGRSATT